MNAKQQIANIDRERVRSARAAAEPLAGLPPDFTDVIISDTDKRVYVEYLQPGEELPVKLQRWKNEDDNDIARVSIAQEVAAGGDPVWEEVDRFEPGEIRLRPPVYVRGIPTEKLTDYNPAGTPSIWLVRYSAAPPGGNPWTSDEEDIEIDRRAHYQANPGGSKTRPPPAIANPAIPASNIINDDYVDSLPNGILELTVGVQGWAAGDKCYLYISDRYTNLPESEPLNPAPHTLPQDGKIEISSSVLRGLPSSPASFLYYRHVDAVGNESVASVALGLKVEFGEPPVLEEPRVPLASSQTDSLIDLKDCADPLGVTVEVDRVDNIKNTNEVQLKWNDTVVDTLPFNNETKLVFPVSFEIISDDYYKDGVDTNYDVPVTVKATLLQGSATLSESSVDIYSNIYVPGPTPENPGPNDELNFPNVTSTTVDNVIEIGDYGTDQEITIDLWTDIDKPVKDGQQIVAVYEGVRLIDVAFLRANQTSAKIELPATVINGAGIGDKSLQYFLSDIGGTNESPSPIQTVINNALVVNLEPPSISMLNEDLLLCADLQPNTLSAVFTIPGNPEHLHVGREVTLHAQGYKDEAHTEPVTTTAFISVPHPIVAGEPESGFPMTILYDPFIRDIPEPPPDPVEPGNYVGYWKVWYTVKIGTTDYPSEDFETEVKLVNAQGEYCEDA